MDMQASKEFLAELKVLTRVYHLNLVRNTFCSQQREVNMIIAWEDEIWMKFFFFLQIDITDISSI